MFFKYAESSLEVRDAKRTPRILVLVSVRKEKKGSFLAKNKNNSERFNPQRRTSAIEELLTSLAFYILIPTLTLT